MTGSRTTVILPHARSRQPSDTRTGECVDAATSEAASRRLEVVQLYQGSAQKCPPRSAALAGLIGRETRSTVLARLDYGIALTIFNAIALRWASSAPCGTLLPSTMTTTSPTFAARVAPS